MLESLKNTLEKYSFRHTALLLSSLCVVLFSTRSLIVWGEFVLDLTYFQKDFAGFVRGITKSYKVLYLFLKNKTSYKVLYFIEGLIFF